MEEEEGNMLLGLDVHIYSDRNIGRGKVIPGTVGGGQEEVVAGTGSN
jgi:hypothetical protein